MRAAVVRLNGEEGVEVLAASPVYRNPPVGPQDQPDFLNAVLELDVRQSPQALLASFLNIEQSLGRVRDVRWGPRTLDLDILLFGDLVLDEPGLTIPHPHMLDRSFVLVPLADLIPRERHPVSRQTYLDLANAVGRTNLERVDVSLLPS